MLKLQIRSYLEHWLYQLQASRHAERWRNFTFHNTSGPRLAITLFIRSHPTATRDEIVEHLMNSRDYGERESCVAVVARNLREMEKSHQISADADGYHILSKVKFVIREEEVWASWFFMVSVGLAVAFFAYAFPRTPFNINTAFIVILFAIIFLKILEDFYSTTPW
jgi:hypothetical protein